MGIPKTSDHIQIKIKMQNLSQEPPMSSKAPKHDLKDMDDLCDFKFLIKSQDLEHGTWDKLKVYKSIKDAKPQSETSSILKINL